MNNFLKSNLREAYNKAACDRDAQAIQNWKLEARSKFLSLLLQGKKESLLEIGAGPGKDSAFFQEQGLKVVCTDLSSEMVKLCKQKGLNAHVMDFCNLQIPDNSYDAVYAFNCLLHLPKKELPAVLKAINSVLKSNGLFYMGVYGGYDHEGIWSEDPYEPKRFFSFYSDERLIRVVNNVFDVYSFERISTNEPHSDLHFQSLVLRKRSTSS